MVVGPAAAAVKGVPGEFPAAGQQVIPAGPPGVNPKGPAGQLDYRQLLLQIIPFRRHQKGEIQIPQIVVHRAAAGQAPGQMAPLRL